MSKSVPLGSALLITLVIATGIANAWEAVARWLEDAVQKTNRQGEYVEICVGVDGEPLLEHSVQVNANYGRYSAEQIMTLSGQPKNVNPADLLSAMYIAGNNGYVTPLAWWNRLAGLNDGAVPESYWYLVHDGQIPGHVYGVGFNSKTKMIVGHFCRTGFTQALPPREAWFDVGNKGLRESTTANVNASEPHNGALAPSFVLLANHKLWRIDLARRQVKDLVDCPAAYAMGSVWQLQEQKPAPAESPDVEAAIRTTPTRLGVRQPDNLIVVDQKTGQHHGYPLPAKLSDAMLAGYVLTDGNLLLAAWWSEHPPATSNEIIWLNPQGEIIKEEYVRLTDRPGSDSIIPEVWLEDFRQPIPLAKALFFAIYVSGEAQQANSLWTGVSKVFARGWLAALALFAVAALLAWFAYRRQKRFGLPHAGVWAAFVFVLGLPGWLAYRFHRAWPVLEDCPSCRQAAPRDHTACTECGAPFPPPPLKGIEVFA